MTAERYEGQERRAVARPRQPETAQERIKNSELLGDFWEKPDTDWVV